MNKNPYGNVPGVPSHLQNQQPPKAPMAVSVNEIACPSCNGYMQFQDEQRGRKVKCPRCSSTLLIPISDGAGSPMAQNAAPIQNQAPIQQTIVQVQQPVFVGRHQQNGGCAGALLSFFIPGLGQLVNGRIAAGILWFLFTCIGYAAFIFPGLLLHLICILDAQR